MKQILFYSVPPEERERERERERESGGGTRHPVGESFASLSHLISVL